MFFVVFVEPACLSQGQNQISKGHIAMFYVHSTTLVHQKRFWHNSPQMLTILTQYAEHKLQNTNTSKPKPFLFEIPWLLLL